MPAFFRSGPPISGFPGDPWPPNHQVEYGESFGFTARPAFGRIAKRASCV